VVDKINRYTNDQCQAIGQEFEPIGPILFKNPLDAGWDLLPTLLWVGSWLPTYLIGFFYQVERRFHGENQTANHSIQKWVPLHYHLVV